MRVKSEAEFSTFMCMTTFWVSMGCVTDDLTQVNAFRSFLCPKGVQWFHVRRCVFICDFGLPVEDNSNLASGTFEQGLEVSKNTTPPELKRARCPSWHNNAVPIDRCSP